MLMTTTPIIEGKRIVKYYGIVSGETIIGPMYSATCLQVFGILWVVVPVLMKKCCVWQKIQR